MQINGNVVEIRSKQPGFKEIAWVLKARSTDAMRRPLLNLHADIDYIVATDGHRLHLAENDMEFPAGEWSLIKATQTGIMLMKTEGADEFPEYWKVMPTHGNPDRRRVLFNPAEKESRGACLADPFYETFSYTQHRFNIDYLSDVFTLNGAWTIETNNEMSARDSRPTVFMRDENCLALVMPLKD